MAVSRMKKVNIVGLKDDKEKILKILQDKELVQINSIEEASGIYSSDESRCEEIENRLKTLDFTIEYILRHKKKKGDFSGFEIIKKSDFESILKKHDIDKINDNIQSIYRRENELINERQNLETRSVLLKSWEKFDAPLSTLGSVGQSQRFLVKISIQMYREYEEEFKNISGGVYYEIINQSTTDIYLFFLTHEDEYDEVHELLKRANFESAEFDGFKGTVSEYIDSVKKEQVKLEEELNSIHSKTESYIDILGDLRVAYDFISSEYAKEKAKENVFSSEYTFLLDGWIETKKIKLLEKALEDFKGSIDIAQRDPLEEEEPPTAYTNKAFASPYEMIVSMYSPPGYREVDPTPLIMPFFTLFFAVCLTDAGYGLVIAILAAIMLLKLPKQKRKTSGRMFKVLIFSGLATVVIGMLTGGIFGINFEKYALFRDSALGRFRQHVMLFDPGSSKGMMVFFVLSLGLGWVHVFFGRIIAFIRKVQTEGILAAVFDQLSWMIVMVGVLFLMLGMVKSMFGVNLVVPAYFAKIGLYLLLAGLAIILIFGGRSAKTIIGKFGSGLFEVYGISSLMGDILSYARLFALGLATGVIAGVFNQLALMMKGIGGIAGIILFIILLVVGHMFNIAMNALGAFIHTLRLQFVEFFGKFYEGGGEEFKPLKRELKYIMIEKENIQ